MRKRVSQVKGMLEDQGYTAKKAQDILDLFDPPKREKTKNSGQGRQ